MIEILKVKREFLYLLLTLTQEKNVKVSRFPLIHLDETIVAHTNLAEFNRNSFRRRRTRRCSTAWSSSRCPTRSPTATRRASISKLVSARRPSRTCTSTRTCSRSRRCSRSSRGSRSRSARGWTTKKLRLYAGEDVEGFSESDVPRIKAESPEEGMTGVSPRFIINAISNAITAATSRA
jgi:serine protein kinase